MSTTQTYSAIDWQEVASWRATELAAFATERSVQFTDDETRRLVAITLREDARRAIAVAETLVGTRPPMPTARRGTIAAIAVAEIFQPDGPYLLLRRGPEVWLVPDVPNGWDYREPWLGNPLSVSWTGGPPAIAAFRRVGAPV